MGSKQVADDTIKILGAVMLLMFVLPFLFTMVDCAGVVTGLHEPAPDPYADAEIQLQQMIEQAEARQEARWEKRYGKTGNGRTQLASGAYYPGADDVEPEVPSEEPGMGTILLMAGGLGVSAVGCVGAIGFLLLGERSEEEQEAVAAEGEPAPTVPAPDVGVALSDPVTAERDAPQGHPEDQTFDEYGRPVDYEPAPLEGYWTHVAVVALVAGAAVFLAFGGRLFWLWNSMTAG